MIPLFKVKMAKSAGEAVSKVLQSGFIGQGEVVEEFENSLQEVLETSTRPVTVNSCTSAIDLALDLCEVKCGDEVISTPQTCLGFNSPVLLSDGTTKKIGQIVNQKYEGLVKSYNEETGKYEDKKIYNWIKVPVTKDVWYRLTIKDTNSCKTNSTKTVKGIWITQDHKVLSNRGWIRIDQLNSFDRVATNYFVPNNKQQEFINGMLLGDGSIQKHKTYQSYRFTTCHTKKHESYVYHINNVLKIKGSLIERPEIIKDNEVVSKEALVYQSYSGVPWKSIFENWYSENTKNKIVSEQLKLTPITLAAWYMDDGNFNSGETRSVQFNTEGFSYESFWRLFYKMVDYGFKPTAVKKSNGYVLRLGEKNNDVDTFFKCVSKYILPCFRYKVAEGYDEYDESCWEFGDPDLYFSSFELTKEVPSKFHFPNFAYCLDVEDNHNFVSNNILVHNCFATQVGAIHRGAKIRWADIDPITGLIDPESVRHLITNKTKAILAVDWAGKFCDFSKLKSFGIPVIEDAAHVWDVFGCNNIERGDYICYSFQAIKFLTCGDGGILICPPEKEQEARILRWYGLDRSKSQSFRCTQNIEKAGYKYHMNDISAIIGLSNIGESMSSVRAHRRNSKQIIESVKNSNLIMPEWDEYCSYWLFSMHVKNGKKSHFIKYLEDNNISSSPVHFRNDLYDCTSSFKENQLSGVDSFSETQVCIPNGWWLSSQDLDHIIKTLNSYD